MTRTVADAMSEGEFTLALGIGFFGFYAHVGAALAVEEAGLAPRAYAGASAGAIVAGALAAGRSPTELEDVVSKLTRRDFWDPFPGLGIIRGRRLETTLRRTFGVRSFDQCSAPLAVSVYDVLARAVRVLRNGDLARAARASCAVPFLFHPVIADGRLLVDPGRRDRDALAGVARDETTLVVRIGRDPRPPRERAVVVTLTDLPSVGPFRLERGRQALEAARDLTRRVLAAPADTVGVY